VVTFEIPEKKSRPYAAPAAKWADKKTQTKRPRKFDSA
jgi:hypothetical protein